MKKVILVFYMLLASCALSLAQAGTVSGTITSAVDGSPLPGVNVIVKGTNTGTVSDNSGEYSVEAGSEATLVISFIGYETIEVPVNNRSVIDISLEEDIQQLDEIVVTGYGTQTKRDVTGSIATVKGQDIAEVPVGSFDQALQGRAAGVQVNRSSGVPGAGVRIQVRGTSSISAGTNPLIVIDGLPVTDNTRSGVNPLSYINPNDIESIDVLKDAQAAAIYGSRGANGVVLVTTKSGKGDGEFNVSYQKGVTSPVNMVDFMGPQDWLSVTDDSYNNAGFDGQWDPVEQQVLLSDSAQSPTNKNHLDRDRINRFVTDNPNGIDYFSPFWRNGSLDEISVSFNQGFENGSIYASGQYRNEQGLVEGLDFKRYQARLNTAFQPLKNLSTGINLNLTFLDNDRIPLGGGGGQQNGGRGDNGTMPNYGVAVNNPPILPHFNPDGSLWDPLGRRNTQLTALPIYENVNQVFRILGNMFLQYEILDGLSLRAEGSVDFEEGRERAWANDFVRPSAYSRESSGTLFNRNLVGYFTYEKTFGDHFIKATAGAEQQMFGAPWRHALAAENLTSANQGIGEIGNFDDDVLVMVVSEDPDTKIRSFFGRLNYKFKDRYLFGFNLRRDGASVFGDGNKWGTFSGVSAGWIVSEEDFAQTLDPVNFLKVRASYGQVGNANIPGNAQFNTFTSWPAYGSGGGVNVNSLGNPSVGWENIGSFDAGVEVGAFENRVFLTASYYQQNVSDMLFQVPIPDSQGVLFGSSTIWQNIGELRNNGLELSLSTINVDNGSFKWTTDVNFTTLSNEVVSLAEEIAENRLGITAFNTTSRPGLRLATYFLPDFAGVDPATGYDMIWEIDQDRFLETGETIKTGRKIVATQQNQADNRFVHEGKTNLPTFFGGINNTLSYQGFNLSFQFTYQGGNYLFDGTEISQTSPSGKRSIRTSYLNNYWTPDNRNAKYPRANLLGQSRDGTGLSREHSRYLYRGDFMRLAFTQLSYNIPQQLINNIGLKAARVFVSGTNLLTFTAFEGFDPEVVRGGSGQAANLGQGFIGGTPFPQVITVTGGINLTF